MAANDSSKFGTGIMVNAEQIAKAHTLAEVLPYMRRHAGATFVVKYGGNAMGDPALGETFARNVVMMKHVGINPVVVHGGGPQISAMLEKLKVETEFVDGLRVTSREAVEVVEMVLAGSINKSIVRSIQAAGGKAIGLSGKDGNLIRARRMRRTRRDPDSNIEKILDLGFVGEPAAIDPELIETFLDTDFIPVIAPIGIDEKGDTYNINADTAAGAIAASIDAARFILLTDVPGILRPDKSLMAEVTVAEARQLIRDGIIHGGMIPKVETCIAAVEDGVEAAVIVDGRVPNALLLEFFTDGGAGTLISQD